MYRITNDLPNSIDPQYILEAKRPCSLWDLVRLTNRQNGLNSDGECEGLVMGNFTALNHAMIERLTPP